LWDIKAAPIKIKDFDTQVICVYEIDDNNIYEIVMLYDILMKNGLIDLHMAQACNNKSISYVTDLDTRNKVAEPRYTNTDIEDLHKLMELKDTVSEQMFAQKWAIFADALECKKKGLPAPVNYVRSYFTQDEVDKRVELLGIIDQHQLANDTSTLLDLDNILRGIRSALTSNYKFTTVELIQHGMDLLQANRPDQNIVSALFNKNPAVDKFNNAIALLKILVKDEQLRLNPPSNK